MGKQMLQIQGQPAHTVLPDNRLHGSLLSTTYVCRQDIFWEGAEVEAAPQGKR